MGQQIWFPVNYPLLVAHGAVIVLDMPYLAWWLYFLQKNIHRLGGLKHQKSMYCLSMLTLKSG